MNWEQSPFTPLVGEIVRELFVSTNYKELVFYTFTGLFKFEAQGDCCSKSWFSDIYGFVPQSKIISIKDCHHPRTDVYDGRQLGEVDKAYGIIAETNNGDIEFVFRNSSNGYYGGWLEYISGDYDFNPFNYINITSDWHRPINGRFDT